MHLPEMGMGCSALGNLYRPMRDAAAITTVRSALDCGIRYFDVAPHYGFGLAERRLGIGLRGVARDSFTISTKVGRLLVPTDDRGPRHGFVDADPFEPVFDYGFDAILSSHEASLGRLGLARVEILLAHDLGALTHGDQAEMRTQQFLDGGYAAMRGLKRSGRIDAIGIGVNEVAICERILDEVEIDVILLAGRYTLLEQGAIGLLGRCAERGVAVIVGGPFNSGLLVESGQGAVHYDYASAPAELIRRANAMRVSCEQFGVPLPAAALAFPAAHPSVASVLPGLADEAQVRQAVAWRQQPIAPALWTTLRDAGLIAPGVPVPA